MEPFAGVEEKGKHRRAKVNMDIQTSEGKEYPIEYALYENDDGRWLLENLILNGVNIGLTFRNQFSEALRKNGGSLDKAINSWSSKVAEFPDH